MSAQCQKPTFAVERRRDSLSRMRFSPLPDDSRQRIFQPMTVDRTVTHLEGTDFQKSRAFSPAIVTQGGKIVWLAGQTALTDLDGKSIVHDFEAQARTCFALIDRTLNRVGGKLADLVTMTVSINDPRHGDRFVKIRHECFQTESFRAAP
jgi:2-iminobutanoate/2-iminopropanoate deaminase